VIDRCARIGHGQGANVFSVVTPLALRRWHCGDINRSTNLRDRVGRRCGGLRLGYAAHRDQFTRPAGADPTQRLAWRMGTAKMT